MAHRRHQHYYEPQVNFASQKTHRGGRVPFAASFLIAAKAKAVNFSIHRHCAAAGLALEIRPVQLASTVHATTLTAFFRKISIALLEKTQ